MQVHVLVDSLTGTKASTLLALRDFLRSAGTWCRDHGQPALAERYLRTSDLLDIADRQLYRLGIDHLTAFHPQATTPDLSHQDETPLEPQCQ